MNIVELYEIYKQYPNYPNRHQKTEEERPILRADADPTSMPMLLLKLHCNGAVYAIIDDAIYNTHASMILVNDALETLQQLALFHRNQFKSLF